MTMKQKQKDGVSLRTIHLWLIIGAVVISCLMFYATYHLSSSFRNLTETSEQQIELRKAARELMDASDYLTESVQRFTVLGDRKFLDEYFKEAFETKRREEAISIMSAANENDAALAELQEAMEGSLELMKREYYAMRLVIEAQGYADYPDVLRGVDLSKEDKALSPAEKMQRASVMVHDDEYYTQKNRIMEDTWDSLDVLEVKAYDTDASALSSLSREMAIFRLVIVLQTICIFIMVWLTSRLGINPILNAVNQIKEDNTISETGANEFQYLARAYNEMYESYKRSLEQLKTEAASLNTIHEMLGSGKWTMDFNEAGVMTRVTWSDEFRRMIGYQDTNDFPDELESWSDLLHPDDRERILKEYSETINDYTGKKTYDVEYQLLTKDRGYRWYRAIGKPTRRPDGSPISYVGVFIDITEQKENARDLSTARRMADIDSLTGVKNKNAFTKWEKEINAAIENGEQEPFAAVVCDINDLKVVNDLHGHSEGDVCIRNACQKICSIFSHSPVFRVGGDEFVVLLSGEDYYSRKKLMEQISAVPSDHSKIRIGETVAAGMAEYKKDQHRSLLSVLEEADKAMYERKQFLKENVLPKENTKERDPAYEYIPVIHTRKQILIVDDIEMNREIMGDLLEDEYDILYASDGVEALDVLRNHLDEIDLLLLDLQMPNKSGREVIAEMQVDEDLIFVPVLVLTSDQQAELDCLRIGAMDFIPKPFPDIDIVKARISKCIELSEDRELIRYTERDKLTGLFNKDYFFRYVGRLDNLYKDQVLDAVVCDVNHFHSLNKQYGRQFCDQVLRSIGSNIKNLARKTGGIGCRKEGDTFLLYCLHQDDYEELLQEFVSGLIADEKITERIDLRFGVYVDARREPNIEERFVRAATAADRVKNEQDAICGFF